MSRAFTFFDEKARRVVGVVAPIEFAFSGRLWLIIICRKLELPVNCFFTK